MKFSIETKGYYGGGIVSHIKIHQICGGVFVLFYKKEKIKIKNVNFIIIIF